MKKVALVTGASSGIGKELAREHARRGGDLIIVARRKQKLEELADELKKKHKIKVEVIDADLSEVGAPTKLFKRISGLGIDVEYLINNAGFGGQGYFHERLWEKDQSMIMLNIMALTELTRNFLPEMVKRNSGRILNVGSTAGLVPGPLQAVYYASKAYVGSFSLALAGELVDTNVTSTVLMPGPVNTEFGQSADLTNTKLFEGKVYDPSDVAIDGYNAMMKGDLKCITGIGLWQKFNLKMAPIVPTKIALKMIKDLQENK